MTPTETLARLADELLDQSCPRIESLYLDAVREFQEAANPSAIKSILARIESLEADIETYHKAISDPAAVWTNILRGTIARPRALDHYEECKAAVERLEGEVERRDKSPNAVEELTALREWIKSGKGYVRDDAPDEISRAITNRISQINAILGGENTTIRGDAGSRSPQPE